MATTAASAIGRPRREIPVRVAKHLRRLGLYSGRDYIEWCRTRGFRVDYRKSWEELETEWSAHRKEMAKVQARAKVDRDPVKLIANVCSGALRSTEISRPRWRALAERVEKQDLGERDRLALRSLVEVVAKRGRILLAEEVVGGERVPLLDGLVALARNSSDWIREPRTWRPRTHNARRQFAALSRHLVSNFPVPQFLDAAWFRQDDVSETYRSWFIQTGTGKNIRKIEGPITWTSRIAHHFLRAPQDYSVEQALRWGQVIALGGHSRLARAIAATRIASEFADEEFWLSVIRFLIANPLLDIRQVGPIVDYLHHQRFVAEDAFIAHGVRVRREPVHPHLSMRGRSLDTLLEQVERWHRDLARRQFFGPPAWACSGIGEFELETGVAGENLHVWTIRELLSFEALRLEGSKMRHCVASYGYNCASGDSSIWTMERAGFEGIEKRVTIEVDRKRQIVQARGRCNRDPSKKEMDLIRRWAARETLQLSATLN